MNAYSPTWPRFPVVAAIVTYIERHSFKVWSFSGTHICVASRWVDANGQCGETNETIEATWEAAREWLGY